MVATRRGVAFLPKTTATALPGSAFVAAKISTEAANSAPRPARSRRMTKPISGCRRSWARDAAAADASAGLGGMTSVLASSTLTLPTNRALSARRPSAAAHSRHSPVRFPSHTRHLLNRVIYLPDQQVVELAVVPRDLRWSAQTDNPVQPNGHTYEPNPHMPLRGRCLSKQFEAYDSHASRKLKLLQ